MLLCVRIAFVNNHGIRNKLTRAKKTIKPKNDLESQRDAFYSENPDMAGKYSVDSDQERQCPHCGNINVCTGLDHCSTCGGSLSGAKRMDTHRFDPGFY
ncbi:MAG TPA: hypothetical protein PK863_01720 [Candidatus Dojkabacteria bacterium]|nr:hypothetical protein [Candidatus Dojkabacteria bacterium]HRP37588.1 hypothetical protein [Candidatus Dojkabacteria bacterium]HRP50821.1 hypothetical protein [Candidatus Dojkabacteria bacterium]